MKISRKCVAIGIGASVLLSGVGIASANNLIFDVTAQLNYEMQMMNNGQEYNPINESNEAIRPLVYEGQVYLPESIIEDAAKLNIDYDEASKELWVGEKSDISFMDELVFHPADSNRRYTIKNLYYSENPKELFVKGKMFSSALKQLPDAENYDDYYFDTGEIAGKANVIGGTIYCDNSADINDVIVKFRKSKDEGQEVLEYITVKPGELVPFEIDTRGANIVVMEIDHNSYQKTYSKTVKIKNLSFFDLYYK